MRAHPCHPCLGPSVRLAWPAAACPACSVQRSARCCLHCQQVSQRHRTLLLPYHRRTRDIDRLLILGHIARSDFDVLPVSAIRPPAALYDLFAISAHSRSAHAAWWIGADLPANAWAQLFFCVLQDLQTLIARHRDASGKLVCSLPSRKPLLMVLFHKGSPSAI